jgi:hypothetical protein
MDPNELLKAAPEVQKIVATIVAGVPIAEIVKAVLVPPAAVLGKRMADRVERCFDKTGRMLHAANSPVQEVPEKLLIPILQGVALEDDENLHTMWAALLANTASPDGAQKVRPGFISILRNMAPDEALVLKALYAGLAEQRLTGGFGYRDLGELQTRLGFAAGEIYEVVFDSRFLTCMDGLESEQLIRRIHWTPKGQRTEAGPLGETPSYHVVVTMRGEDFIEACQPPKPKENG